jgi:hypothetical protein
MKITGFKLLLFAMLALTVCSSCRRFRCIKGTGSVRTETRKLGNFTKIDIAGGYKVTLKQDSSGSVAITTDDNLISHIETTVEGSTLNIHVKGHRSICASGETTIVIGVKNIEKISASGTVDVTSVGRLNTKDLDFDLSGSTTINLDINAGKVHTDASGSTEIYLKGQATSHDMDLSGLSKVEALDFVVGKYKVGTSGASNCKINVLNELEVHTSGASEIEYRGNPPKVSNHQSGASSIKKIN